MNIVAPKPQADPADRIEPGKDLIDIFLPVGTSRSAAQTAVDLLDVANDLLPEQGYQWRFRTLTTPPAEDPRFWRNRTLLFLGSMKTPWFAPPQERQRLRRMLTCASRVLLVGGAVMLPASVGWDPETPLAVHPNFDTVARENHIEPAPGGVIDTGRIMSAISTFAVLKALLSLIAADHGRFIADAIAEHAGLQPSGPTVRSKHLLKYQQRSQGDPLVAAALEKMMSNIENPKTIADIARMIGASTRKLERRFHDKLGETPRTVYCALRIERAHDLIRQTTMPPAEVAVATGFGSSANLNQWYRRTYGHSPRAARKQVYVGA
jgi:transcriptional regulator GlxA family with amidase domain